ncbi:Thymidylate synthase ThyX [Candidatus Bilamarchaeum dharawalense]|uniref:Thymidylate synthase ThyX n=1 Tax=Candidatus Bilamarchaeum dharawalense TaxID=2885759 RepID=A0A5E4LPD0_9ARCH|nr:Thymidylate synthase ThyX [Candidatus Bilamarchaeum dharawalense]
MDSFTSEEKALLENFVSNTSSSVFVLKNLPEVVKGALFSRYSRSAKSLRRVLLDEFMLAPEIGLGEGLEVLQKKQQDPVQTRKAEEFYERVLVGYGDDSVAELAGAHIAMEDISILATKIVEDARIGLSPLEKSTRYVYFDTKKDGRWMYLQEKTLMGSEFAELYQESCDFCFETYADLIPKVSEWVMKKSPKDKDTTDRAYKSTIRAKTCDLLRGLLPASTLTNMGFFGDGRAYEYLLTKMFGDDLAEVKDLATMMQTELAEIIPSFVKRSNGEFGILMQNYLKKVAEDTDALASRYAGASGGEGVTLVEYDKDAERKIVVSILYPHLQKPMDEIGKIVEKMTKEEKEKIIKLYIGERQNRRHKPGRAFEHVFYTFDVCGNYGAYRDLHRHRILTQQRQPLTPFLGYKIPHEIVEAGFEKEFKAVMDRSKEAYGKIVKKYPKEAQYVVPLAYNIRWYMRFNVREAYHLLELRSSMQGHRDYREIAQQMFKEIERVHPLLASGMKFMDMKEYEFERLEAEKRIDIRLEEIAKKYG